MARRVAASEDITQAEMFRAIGEKLKLTAREPNILAYKPHPKQVLFHSSQAKTRLYIGGNRSGKTVGGVVEDIFYLRGQHPYRRVPEAPVRGRAICVDFTHGIQQILIPKLKQWLPPSLLVKGSWERSYNSEKKELTLSNGSTLEFLTYEQDLAAHAGTSRHFVHFDEEPPKHIYDENMLRLVDTDGDTWLTLTPVEGMTWIYDGIYKPGSTGLHQYIDVVEVDIHENPYLKPEAIERILGGLDADERKAREKGQFVQLGGKVYKNFSVATHVIPPINPKSVLNWEWYRSMDHGFNNPTAWLWHAVHADGTIVTFAEHYASEMTVAEHAKVVLKMDKELGKEPEFCVGDPATQQRQAVTGTSIVGEYAANGIWIAPGNNDVLTGVNQVSKYLSTNPRTKKPYWQITENCTNLIREMERLRWETYSSKSAQFNNNAHEKIHKKDDHACDSARYFFTFMPDLAPDPATVSELMPRDSENLRYDQVLARMYLDDRNRTEWSSGANAVEWDGF
jgi:phage terminase large subunit-like protein